MTMTKFALRNAMGQSYGSWYWMQRGRFNQSAPREMRVQAILDYRRSRRMLAEGEWTLEKNARGNTIWRDEDADEALGAKRGGDRYYYDCGPCKGWRQFDTRQDASYFGVWVDTEGLRVFTYAEGDRTLVVCDTRESLSAELASMAEFYGEPPPAFVAYGADGTRTEYYDTRPT